jgi:ferredoxin
MAMQISKACFGCYACETVCPTGAITQKGAKFVINPKLCNECEPSDSKRCVAICPEPLAIYQKKSK